MRMLAIAIPDFIGFVGACALARTNWRCADEAIDVKAKAMALSLVIFV